METDNADCNTIEQVKIESQTWGKGNPKSLWGIEFESVLGLLNSRELFHWEYSQNISENILTLRILGIN